ncbi:LysM peptidoglycan-binding domain-containing protein [Methylobacterium fujisawaense]|uniref:LysM peptidoglycan-binding domain-containing protein n=1 Tax=Methylobacterium fujisawaense TaxID=107400 RepID=UPI00313B2CD8
MTALALIIGTGMLTAGHGYAEEAACGGGPVKVLPDDTLSRIASRCDVSEGALLAANPSIDGSGDLQVGATLRLRTATAKVSRIASTTSGARPTMP